ncbi:MAG: hypothetical protein WCK32_00170 [Chlorobiaceae bacterium]
MNDIISTFYKTASQHFLSRLQMRDNITLLYLTGVGTVVGFAFGSPTVKKELLLVLPYMALACAPLMVHHNVMLGSLLNYLSKEIPSTISETTTSPPYEASQSLQNQFALALGLRTFGQLIIFLLPSFFALIATWSLAFSGPLLQILAYWTAVFSFLLTFFIVFLIHKRQTHDIDHLKKFAKNGSDSNRFTPMS